MTTYDVIDSPANGTAGQHCGTFALAELPQRLQAAIGANPDAGEWRVPALSGGDTGEQLDDLTTIVRANATPAHEGSE